MVEEELTHTEDCYSFEDYVRVSSEVVSRIDCHIFLPHYPVVLVKAVEGVHSRDLNDQSVSHAAYW